MKKILIVVTLLLAACTADSPESSSDRGVLLTRCGGFGPGGPIACPSGYLCVGDRIPIDGPGACRRLCDPTEATPCGPAQTCVARSESCTGADCYYCRPQVCGGFAGDECPDSASECADDGTDACEPGMGDADCPGICVSE
jgi:hypothetical protein